jgi:hypothetical protein
MRKLVLITAAVVALGCTGLAVAHGLDSKSVKLVSASFTVSPSGSVKTSTCTGSDGTYAITKGTYTGTISGASDGNLNGPVTVDAQSLVNTSTNTGVVTGRIRFGSSDDNRANFEAVYSGSGGNLAGLAEGHVNASNAALLGNISSTFNATSGGFTSPIKLGGTSGGDAVEITRGGCQPTPPPKPERIHVVGGVTLGSGTPPTTLTVAGVTCNIPSDLQSKIGALGLTNGTRVEMDCTASGGTNTLTKLETQGHGNVKEKGPKHD